MVYNPQRPLFSDQGSRVPSAGGCAPSNGANGGLDWSEISASSQMLVRPGAILAVDRLADLHSGDCNSVARSRGGQAYSIHSWQKDTTGNATGVSVDRLPNGSAGAGQIKAGLDLLNRSIVARVAGLQSHWLGSHLSGTQIIPVRDTLITAADGSVQLRVLRHLRTPNDESLCIQEDGCFVYPRGMSVLVEAVAQLDNDPKVEFYHRYSTEAFEYEAENLAGRAADLERDTFIRPWLFSVLKHAVAARVQCSHSEVMISDVKLVSAPAEEKDVRQRGSVGQPATQVISFSSASRYPMEPRISRCFEVTCSQGEFTISVVRLENSGLAAYHNHLGSK